MRYMVLMRVVKDSSGFVMISQRSLKGFILVF